MHKADTPDVINIKDTRRVWRFGYVYEVQHVCGPLYLFKNVNKLIVLF